MLKVMMICAVDPFARDHGAKLAIYGDFCALRSLGIETRIVAYAIRGEKAFEGEEAQNIAEVLPSRPGGRLVRYLRSMGSGMPAVYERLYSDTAKKRLIETVRRESPDVVILEDISMSGWVDVIRGISQGIRIVIRTLDFIAKVYTLDYKMSSFWRKPFSYHEMRRLIACERDAYGKVDQVWAITEDETEQIRSYYASPNIRFLPVYLKLDEFNSIPIDDSGYTNLLHLGRVDLIRVTGLDWFVSAIWPRIQRKHPEYRLLLGGKMIKGYPDKNIRCLGEVASASEFYRSGRFAINPQTVGGGIKLKTLCSMAAGKTLMSTPIGVEGMTVTNGEHYWEISKRTTDDELDSMLSDKERNLEMARRARQWVNRNITLERSADTMKTLLEGLR